MLFTVVYISRATKPLNEEDLNTILSVSRRNNAITDITGLLIYKDGEFMQALEGDREVVEELVSRISKDDRHKDVMILARKEIPQRCFSEWQMGFQNLSGIEYEGLIDSESFFSEKNNFLQSQTAINFLSRFYHQN